MPVITRDAFCEAGRPADRLVWTLLFTRFAFVHSIQRINFKAYLTNHTPRVYIHGTGRHGGPVLTPVNNLL
jgi:hypothetical protein